MERNKENSLGHSIKIVVVLTAICVMIALLLAVVNNLTKDVIAENAVREQKEAILALFPEGEGVIEYDKNGTTVYVVTKSGELIGYCIPSTGAGFGGEISAMIGFDTSSAVSGIKITAMSETAGVGTKVKNDTFLSRFFGKSEPVTIGETVDGISGATFSSKGVAQAVNNAMAVGVDVNKMATEIGVTVSAGN